MKKYIFLSITCGILGAEFCSWHQGWIIIAYPSYTSQVNNFLQSKIVSKKKVQLSFWHKEEWQHEQKEMIWSQNKQRNISYLINSWLSALDECSTPNKRVILQTTLISTSEQQAYLSFDQNPFTNRHSTYEKWLWIEGLLKTLRENNVALQTVQFLVHHQPMQDAHLDFDNPWPLTGFLE